MCRTRFYLVRAAVPVVIVIAAVAAAAPGKSATSAMPTASRAWAGSAGAPGSVLLPDGDQVRAIGSGFALSDGQDPLVQTILGGQLSLIPAAALPYVGHGLAPGLFQPAALRTDERPGRLPLAITYSGSVPRIAGVTITRARAGHASGYLTARSAKVFGAALARLDAHDRRRGSFGADGMFSAGVRIGLPGESAFRAAPRPAGPVRVLTVDGINIAGQPDTGDSVQVTNVENYKLFAADKTFSGGKATFSLPPGTYWANGTFMDPDGALRTVVLPQFTVTADKTIRLDERTATSELSVTTPRPSSLAASDVNVARPAAHGDVVPLVGWDVPSGARQYVNTTSARPTVGRLRVFVSAGLTGPAGRRYLYETGFMDLSGLIHPLRYRATPASLATVGMNLFASTSRTGSAGAVGTFARTPYPVPYWAGQTVPVPGPVTLYLTASPAMDWSAGFGTSDDGQGGAFTRYQPGRTVTGDWNAYPLHPAPNVSLLGAADPAPEVVSASRSGNVLHLNYTPFSDSMPGHLGNGFFPASGVRLSGTYRITANGRTIQSGTAIPPNPAQTGFGFTGQAKLPAAPSLIGFTLNAARTAPAFTLSTASSTTWTWHSAFAGRHILANPWFCSYTLTSQDCVAQPLLTLGYSAAGLALDGQTAPGRQRLGLTVGHLQAAAAPAIRKVTVQVSPDNGRTWHPAAVTGENGSYRAMYSAPAHAFITLRVTATDAAGATISETITRAYATA